MDEFLKEKSSASFEAYRTPDSTDIPEIKIPTMIPLKEASEKTGLSYHFLRQLCLEGKIVYVRAGTKYLINLEKLVEYLQQGEG